MENTSFNLGRDGAAIVNHILAPSGGRLELKRITGFHQQPGYDVPTSFNLGGEMLSRPIAKGWSGSFDIDRIGPEIDQFCAAIEVAQQSRVPFQYGVITFYINELDGSVSTFQFQKAAIWVTDVGSYMGDQVVKQKVNFAAPFRSVVS